MAKSKKSKKERTPNIPKGSILRPRLDALCRNEALSQHESDALYQSLDKIASGIKPDLLVSTMLAAYLDAPQQAQSYLDQVFPFWLNKRDFVDVLAELIEEQMHPSRMDKLARTWFEACGGNVDDLDIPDPVDLFYRAYYLDAEWQASLSMMWYVNARRIKVRGLAFLIDHNPPWDGALKEIMVYPIRTPDDLIKDFIEVFRDPTGLGDKYDYVSVEEGKDNLMRALACNCEQKIRLHKEIVDAREDIARYLMPLPGKRNTPPLTMDDFDFASNNGTPAEEIMHYEQTVARQIRTDDGKIVYIDAAIANEQMRQGGASRYLP